MWDASGRRGSIAAMRNDQTGTLGGLSEAAGPEQSRLAQPDAVEELLAVIEALTAGDARKASAIVIEAALWRTESEFGFLGVIAKAPALRILAHAGVAWHTAGGDRPCGNAMCADGEQGCIELGDFDNLFGHVITTGAPVLANDLGTDPQLHGTPPGLPPVHDFLGVPVCRGTEVVGMIGVANRPGGYSERERENVRALARAASVICESCRRCERDAALDERRREMEMALRASEERHRIVSKLISDYAYAFRFEPDRTPTVEWGTEASFQRITGFTPAEIEARGGGMTIVHPEDLPIARKRVKNLVSGRRDTSEFRIVTKNGDVRWIREYGYPQWSEAEQRVFRVYAAAQDVTERKRAEEQVRASEARYAELVASVDGIVWEADAERSHFSFVSRQAERLLGHSLERWIAEKDFWREHLYPDDRERVIAHCADATREMRTHDLEYRMLAADGRTVWLHDIASVAVRDGRAATLRGIMMDITERKRAQERANLFGFQQTALAQLGQVALTGADLPLLMEETVDLLAQTLGESCHLFELLSDGEALVLRNAAGPIRPAARLNATSDAESPVACTIRTRESAIIHAPDDPALARGSSTPTGMTVLIGTREEPYGVLGVVSDRRRTFTSDDLYFLQAAANIMGQAIRRSRAEEELVEHASELMRSNAALEQFAYAASHDLREPLRNVAIFAQLLARRYRDRLDPAANEFIGYIVEGAARMDSLVNGLLQYSSAGAKGLCFTRIDCEAILRQVLDSLASIAAESGASITHDPLPAVVADAGRLGQILQNLLQNAIKFRRPDLAPRIHVGVIGEAAGECRAGGARRMITLFVRDDGIGIAREYHDRIFGIFRRLHRHDAYPGTGIGLALCKRIVEQHGGTIWLDSQPGRGSTFYFTIPAAS